MDIRTKHRMIGVVVLIALAMMIIPLFFNHAVTSSKKMAHQEHPAYLRDAEAHPPQALQTINNLETSENNSADKVAATQIGIPEDKQPAAQTQSVNQSSLNQTALNETPENQAPAQPASAPKNIRTLQDLSIPTPSKESANNESIHPHAKVHPDHSPAKSDLPRNKMGVVKTKVAMKKSAVVEVGAWTIQLASFSQKNNADQLVKKLKEKGFKAYVSHDQSGKTILNRVYVGHELKREKADQLLKQLHQDFQLKGVIVKDKA